MGVGTESGQEPKGWGGSLVDRLGNPADAGPLSAPLPNQHANYYGSLFQASTVSLGSGPSGEVWVPFRDLLPMVHPDDIVFDGKDPVCKKKKGKKPHRIKGFFCGWREETRLQLDPHTA